MPSESKAKIESGPSVTEVAKKFGRSNVVLFSFLLFLMVLGLVVRINTPAPKGYSNDLSIAGQELDVEIADSVVERQQGLSNRIDLPDDTGMLFVFDEAAEHGFWMKDMQFSIDMIWIDEARQVVHIEEGVSPNTFPEVFRPSVPALYVLEVDAGFTAEHDLQIGDPVNFEL